MLGRLLFIAKIGKQVLVDSWRNDKVISECKAKTCPHSYKARRPRFLPRKHHFAMCPSARKKARILSNIYNCLFITQYMAAISIRRIVYWPLKWDFHGLFYRQIKLVKSSLSRECFSLKNSKFPFQFPWIMIFKELNCTCFEKDNSTIFVLKRNFSVLTMKGFEGWPLLGWKEEGRPKLQAGNAGHWLWELVGLSSIQNHAENLGQREVQCPYRGLTLTKAQNSILLQSSTHNPKMICKPNIENSLVNPWFWKSVSDFGLHSRAK